MLFNPNASCFGKYTELQFTDRSRFCGIKTLDYYLEQNRGATIGPPGECTSSCTEMLFNPNASHFGKYTELQFTDHGRFCGIKTLNYYLERNQGAAIGPPVECTSSCAETLFNPNASRFGKYTELQFTDHGRFCGIKTLDYYLEQNQGATVGPPGERNPHLYITLSWVLYHQIAP